MADENTGPDVRNQAFVRKLRANIADGLAFLRLFAALKADYEDLIAGKLNAADFVGDLYDLTPTDVATVVAIVSSITDGLDTNDGAARKVCKKVATYV